MDNIAIKVNDVYKSFKLYHDRSFSLKETLLFKNRRKYVLRNVLNGVSFEVRRGEAVGLIGHNGCGKSTVLKLLSRIMYPDKGSVEINGRVSSLIELGAGFHPDMSGRENIYTNAAIFGLSKKETDEVIQDIIDFSEIEEFIDDPVRTYSSGMYMRLAFSVAINVKADILLIDEILAVGDVTFQNKCFNKLKEIKAQGTTIVIVSHSLGQIEQICDRSVWLNDGVVVSEGDPKTIHMTYLDHMIDKKLRNSNSAPPKADSTDPKNRKRWGSMDARISSVILRNSEGTEVNSFKTGDNIDIEVIFGLDKEVADASFGIGIFNSTNVQCYGTNTRIDGLRMYDLKTSGSFAVHLENVLLLPGKYFIDLAIEQGQGIPVDYFRSAASFEITSAISDVGVSRIEHEWDIRS